MKKKWILFVSLAVIAAMILTFALIAGKSGKAASEESRRQLHNAILQAAITCYAVEGYYPSELETLMADYALRYDEEQYIVRYDFFADNVLPDISVYARR